MFCLTTNVKDAIRQLSLKNKIKWQLDLCPSCLVNCNYNQSSILVYNFLQHAALICSTWMTSVSKILGLVI